MCEAIAPGTPFWYEDRWLSALKKDSEALRPGQPLIGMDMYLRDALMMGGQYGSSNKAVAATPPERRYLHLRMCLGLGLRVLATQSAAEYVSDVGFDDQDVTVWSDRHR